MHKFALTHLDPIAVVVTGVTVLIPTDVDVLVSYINSNLQHIYIQSNALKLSISYTLR